MNEYSEKISALMAAIKEDGYGEFQGDADKAFETLNALTGSFTKYYMDEVKRKIQMMFPVGSDAGTEPIPYDDVISSLYRLNHLCEAYGVGKFKDIEIRPGEELTDEMAQKLHDFIGDYNNKMAEEGAALVRQMENGDKSGK